MPNRRDNFPVLHGHRSYVSWRLVRHVFRSHGGLQVPIHSKVSTAFDLDAMVPLPKKRLFIGTQESSFDSYGRRI